MNLSKIESLPQQNASITAPVHTKKIMSNNGRIAELFVDENLLYSEKIKQGQPNVYLLNATEKFMGTGLRWFNVGKIDNIPHPAVQWNHKVIILMGATGSGKSTLIDGMFNYFLGVQWRDPFRFKVVREEESIGVQGQTHSQTTSVTAYTLLHQRGMAVPFSITVIDTPGYGGIRGIEGDKEITRAIHHFLTQPGTRIDQIHAVCFVATSGDSRLTATQRFIIDSIRSIFGKPVEGNLQLLVTFADNTDPPVVEACFDAHFPVTSAGVTYSKFNSSVLYSSNQINDKEVSSFDELLWNMGQENFCKFFHKLEGMNERDMKSAREMMQQMEKTIKNIEVELEGCISKIKNTEQIGRKYNKACDPQIEANQKFSEETAEIQTVKANCKEEFKFYNCNKTCGANSKVPHLKTCACTEKSKEINPATTETKNSLLELNAESETNCNRKQTTKKLLTHCIYQLNLVKSNMFSLLDQLDAVARTFDSMTSFLKTSEEFRNTCGDQHEGIKQDEISHLELNQATTSKMYNTNTGDQQTCCGCKSESEGDCFSIAVSKEQTATSESSTVGKQIVSNDKLAEHNVRNSGKDNLSSDEEIGQK